MVGVVGVVGVVDVDESRPDPLPPEPLPPEAVAVADAHGRILATDLAARRTQPPADVSAMDGYAVRAAVRERSGLSFPPGVEPAALPDLVRPVDWHPLLNGIDAVVHLAAIAHAGNRNAITVSVALPAGGHRPQHKLQSVAAGQGMTVGTGTTTVRVSAGRRAPRNSAAT